MSKQKKSRLKELRLTTLSLFVSLSVALTAGYVIWRITRDSTEITLKLDGSIIVGTLADETLEGLELTYRKIAVRNVIKISWSIINTGTKGISEFETYPSLIYPGGFVPQAEISETSPLLQINKDLLIDPINTAIKITSMGIFNPKDFFRVDVYLIDIPDTLILTDYLKNWDLKAKAVDLSITKSVVSELSSQPRDAPRWVGFIETTILPLIMAISLIMMMVSVTSMFLKRIRKRKP